MAFNQIIKAHSQPSLKLIELGDFDTASDSNSESFVKKPTQLPDFSQSAGKTMPFVKLNGQIITIIDNLTIYESGFIPTLELIFTDQNGEFAGNYFPKRNLIVSIFINSGNDKFKPIRSDYLITKVKSLPVVNRSANTKLTSGTTYIIKAELFIPRLYNNISRSYSKLTSIDTLKKVSKDLGLGYAQNEFTTHDTMTWINFNTSSYNFMREVLDYSYQDDTSFFTGFISKELIFTMINVNEQLIGGESDFTFSNTADPLKVSLIQDQKENTLNTAISKTTIVNFLTNQRTSAGKPNYIYEANLVSEHGEILKMNGYKKEIYYYDHFESDETKKFKTFFITPTHNESLPKETMLIPQDEGFDEVGHKKWMNINYGNTHEHWNAARVFNSHNLKELNKLNLRVLLKGVNFQIIRGMSIPVLMTQSMAERLLKETDATSKTQINPNNETLDSETIDSQISGLYYVKEAKYIFDPLDPHIFLTELILARREWRPSKINFTTNA